MASSFHEQVVLGAADHAKLLDFDLLVFSGGPFYNPDPIGVMRDRIFDLVNTPSLDGIIVPMGSLSRYISVNEAQAFLDQFASVPIVTIVSDQRSTAHIGVDNVGGITDLVRHLVQDHGYKRFAFARGHAAHISSNEKMAAFRSALQSHGIRFDDRMVLFSDLKKNALLPGIDSLLNISDEWPEVIVSINDNQAVAIMDHLKDRGISVPKDIAVTGCMAIEEGAFYDPPLTSVDEPVYKLGWEAMQAMANVLSGSSAAGRSITLPTRVVRRQSCGCKSVASTAIEPPAALPVNELIDPSAQASLEIFWALQKPLQIVVNDAPPHVMNLFSAKVLDEILAHLQVDLSDKGDSSRLGDFFSLLMDQCVRSDAIAVCGALAQIIHTFLLRQMRSVPDHHRAATVAQTLFNVTISAGKKALMYRDYEAERYVSFLRELGIQLNADFDATLICRLLQRDLDILDCYVCLSDDTNRVGGSVTNVLAMCNGKVLSCDSGSFNAQQLVPNNVIWNQTRSSLIFLPLSFNSEAFGYIALSLNQNKGVLYETLRTLFSAALQNKIRLRDIRAAEEKFSDIALSASDWLWEIDVRGTYTYCSDGVQSVLGYRPEDIVGHSVFEFIGNANASHIAKFRRAMASDTDFTGQECIHRHQDGRERTLLASGRPVHKAGKIVAYRGAFKDITAVKEQEARILTLAYRDPLTNLPNRSLFNDRLGVALSAAQRNKNTLAVLFLDLDGFKLVNDTLGHDAGDQLLCVVAERVGQCLREVDTLARFGGDEFIIVLPQVESISDVITVADRIISSFNAPINVRDQKLFTSTSLGVAIYPHDGDDAETLIKNADKAMYKAKEQGKKCFVFYETAIEEKLQRTANLRNLLHRAVQEKRFFLMYQPQISASNGRVVGVEALIRLKDDQGNWVSPTEFIPVTEEIGLIEEIGMWVFEQACRQQKIWADAGCHLKCSVNVSARQFRAPDLADRFIDIVEQHAVDPNMLVLEITEHAVIDCEEMACATLERLSEYGMAIAIDDFGTGYASLSILRKFPLDIVKIDRSFVIDCLANKESANIVAAIVLMSKSLSLRVVAEGVETEDQTYFISAIGCDEMQGYWFAKPLAVEAVAGFVAKRANFNAIIG